MKTKYPLGDAIDLYLNTRRSLGFRMKTDGNLLRSFQNYAERSDHEGPLTEALTLNWARLPEKADPL